MNDGATAVEVGALVPRRREWFGHPRGLWVLAGTELWDRISFHGMQAMLVLYMTATCSCTRTGRTASSASRPIARRSSRSPVR